MIMSDSYIFICDSDYNNSEILSSFFNSFTSTSEYAFIIIV
jgi:hypothetical protein